MEGIKANVNKHAYKHAYICTRLQFENQRLTRFVAYPITKTTFHSFLGYRSGGPGSIPGTTKKVVGLERGPLSLVSTTEEQLDRKVAAPV
jgi:hypothetical protein